jgi:hypothetical protein
MMTLAARAYPRVSPGTLRGIGKRHTRRPSRRKGDTRKRHRVGVEMTWISPDPPKNHTSNDPKCSTKLATHQRATTALQSPLSSHHEPCCEASKTEKRELLRGKQYSSKPEGTTSTTVGGSRPDAAAGTIRPILAWSGLNRARKAPPPHCSKQATVTATQPEDPLLRPPGAPPPRLRRPSQTQMGPKGPDLGR